MKKKLSVLIGLAVLASLIVIAAFVLTRTKPLLEKSPKENTRETSPSSEKEEVKVASETPSPKKPENDNETIDLIVDELEKLGKNLDADLKNIETAISDTPIPQEE